MQKLRLAIENLNQSLQKSISVKKQMKQRFFMGLAYGLGTVLAVSLFIPLLILLLDKIEWVPVIGDFVNEVIQHLQKTK